jgi:hypothetical protein
LTGASSLTPNKEESIMEDEEYLRDQIRNSLNLKDTEELVEMWQTHDTEEWTDLAIVGFACENCGYVFFMLKDFI